MKIRFTNEQVKVVSDFLQDHMKKNSIIFLTADESAELLSKNKVLSMIPPKPGFHFRQMLRDGRDGKIILVQGANQLRPHTKWIIRRVK